MFKLLSGVLQLGNIEFMTAGGAQITTKQGQFACKVSQEILNVDKCIAVMYSIFVHLLVVSNASELLGLDAFQLSEVLTQRSIILRGEEICSPLTIEQVKHTHIFILPLLFGLQHSHTPTLTLPLVSLLYGPGCGFQRLCCHGVIFPVFLLDHPQDQSKDQREGKL